MAPRGGVGGDAEASEDGTVPRTRGKGGKGERCGVASDLGRADALGGADVLGGAARGEDIGTNRRSMDDGGGARGAVTVDAVMVLGMWCLLTKARAIQAMAAPAASIAHRTSVRRGRAMGEPASEELAPVVDARGAGSARCDDIGREDGDGKSVRAILWADAM